jgi:hypothetical protein
MFVFREDTEALDINLNVRPEQSNPVNMPSTWRQHGSVPVGELIIRKFHNKERLSFKRFILIEILENYFSATNGFTNVSFLLQC